MPQGEPISHAEMIATVRQIVLDADDDPTPPTLTHDEVAILSAVLAHLERTQPTAAEARRAAIEECERIADIPASDSRADVAGTARYIRDAIRALLASPPAPQEEKR